MFEEEGRERGGGTVRKRSLEETGYADDRSESEGGERKKGRKTMNMDGGGQWLKNELNTIQ